MRRSDEGLINKMEKRVLERNSMLDILKGIGMLLVILTHFNWTNEERLTFLFPFWVGQAVPIFIIISGYVYAMSYKRNNILALSDGYRLTFILNKIIRYTIPFLFAFLLEVLALIVLKSDYGFQDMVAILLTGGTGPGSYYFPIMIQFIFTFPFVFAIVKKYDFVGVIFCFTINGLYELIQRAYGMSSSCYRLLLFRYLFLMAFGCYMYIGKSKPKRWVGILSGFVGALWIFAFQYLGYQPKIIIYWAGTCLIAALWIVPIIWKIIKNDKLTNLHIKPLEYLGHASYNVFLTQMVFYNFAAEQIYKYIESRWLQLALCLVINCAIGVIFYTFENIITNKILKYVKGKDYGKRQIKKMINELQSNLVQ